MTEERLEEIKALVAAGKGFEDDYYFYGGPDPTGVQGYRERLFKMTKAANDLLAELEHHLCPRSSGG